MCLNTKHTNNLLRLNFEQTESSKTGLKESLLRLKTTIPNLSYIRTRKCRIRLKPNISKISCKFFCCLCSVLSIREPIARWPHSLSNRSKDTDAFPSAPPCCIQTQSARVIFFHNDLPLAKNATTRVLYYGVCIIYRNIRERDGKGPELFSTTLNFLQKKTKFLQTIKLFHEMVAVVRKREIIFQVNNLIIDSKLNSFSIKKIVPRFSSVNLLLLIFLISLCGYKNDLETENPRKNHYTKKPSRQYNPSEINIHRNKPPYLRWNSALLIYLVVIVKSNVSQGVTNEPNKKKAFERHAVVYFEGEIFSLLFWSYLKLGVTFLRFVFKNGMQRYTIVLPYYQ